MAYCVFIYLHYSLTEITVMKKYLCLVAILLPLALWGQKRAISIDDYGQWKTIGGFRMTDNGRFISCHADAAAGNDTLYLVDTRKNNEVYKYGRASSPSFSPENRYFTFVVKPPFEKERKGKKKESSVDTLCILDLSSFGLLSIPGAASVEFPEKSDRFVSFRMPKNKNRKKSFSVIRDMVTGVCDTLYDKSNLTFSPDGSLYIFSDDSTLFSRNLATGLTDTLLSVSGKADIRSVTFSEDGSMFVFYANTNPELRSDANVEIFCYDVNGNGLRKVVSNNVKGLEEDWKISRNRALHISDDNSTLFFGVGRLMPVKDSTADEIASLDIWHYAEDLPQTIQLQNVERSKRKSYLSCISLKEEDAEMKMLARPGYSVVSVPDNFNASWGYCLSDEKYLLQSQWNANPENDLYIVDLHDGSSSKIVDGGFFYSFSASPGGRYLTWYDPSDGRWYCYDHKDNGISVISGGIESDFSKRLHDTPQMAFPYGDGGWFENDEIFMIYDEFDVWAVDPEGMEKPYRLTQGRESGLVFRVLRVDQMQYPAGTPGITVRPLSKKEPLYYTSFNVKTKGNGYWKGSFRKGNSARIKPLIMEDDYSLGYFFKAKDSDIISFVRSSFSESPDLYITKDYFKTYERVTDINPQQSGFIWGTCELVSWKAWDGRNVEGLLYKPENFDPKEKYPMITYFYEKRSDLKNTYINPALSASTINITHCVSNGYLVFMPDIHYETGHPGKSAMNCIVSGVEYLCGFPWVDKENLGIQGQSWGGYQTAYIVTQTDLFKAACAGAPVSNMTSAYGGVRWGSGQIRQFQYEHTQSRIGKSLWDEGGLELYIENSPLFHLDRMNTPLLVLCNDADGAVPWYQGIELITAMRRLGKVGWMLQYNKEQHNLVKDINKKDFSIRLYQFFDHYLKGAPIPVWMKNGVPAHMKGISSGLEY